MRERITAEFYKLPLLRKWNIAKFDFTKRVGAAVGEFLVKVQNSKVSRTRKVFTEADGIFRRKQDRFYFLKPA